MVIQIRTRGSRRSAAMTGAVFMAAAAIALPATPAFAAAVSSVCADDCDFATIQEAVDSAAPGDTINIGAGAYAEAITIDKPLTLVGEGAVVNTPVGGGHAISLTSAATPVSISGLTVDLDGANDNQRFVSVGSGTDRVLTIAGSTFVNGPEATGGSFVLSGAMGNASITFTGNTVQNSGPSNGLQVHNSSGGSTTNLTITDNTWTDNLGLAMNISGNSARTGTIANNTISNSTPGVSGVDGFGVRQGGMVLAGPFGGLEITNNTMNNVEDAAFSFWDNFSGELSITSNTIDGYNNMPGYAAVYVRAAAAQVGDVTFTDNSITNPTEGSTALLNRDGAGTFDASANWWGAAPPDFDQLIEGPNVITHPYYVDASLSALSPQAPEVALSAPVAMLQGEAAVASASLDLEDATGTLELFDGTTSLATAAAADGIEFDLSTLSEGTYNLTAVFTPEDELDFAAATSAVMEVNVNVKQDPVPAPAEDSAALDELIEDLGLDVAATTAGFVPKPGTANDDLGDLDADELLEGELPWSAAEDSFVDVYAYSSPVHLGTFPVVNGAVQVQADISGLEPGTHKLLFIGQTSGEIQVIEITVADVPQQTEPTPPGDGAEPTPPGDDDATPAPGGNAQLPRTGAEASFGVIGLAGLALMLGLGLLFGGARGSKETDSLT